MSATTGGVSIIECITNDYVRFITILILFYFLSFILFTRHLSVWIISI